QAAADRIKRDVADKARQDAAQQQAAADKARQDAAQQQAAADRIKRDAADKARQDTAQQQAAADRIKRDAADKAKQDAAQQAADKAPPKQGAGNRPRSDPATKPPSEAPPANQRAVPNKGPVRVAEDAQAAKLVSQPKLNDPQRGKGANVHGTVRMRVLIGVDGKVKDASVLSGPQPLQAAALENVQQRRYQPTVVDGQPVEVETEVSIKF
ncbi:MAG: energy transducer TonB, partial [Acidobacteria bacterium]|nr:energy transducer TonB [Acidobacteriota bacterium]